MQRNFERALEGVLKHEGGFVNHPNDPGGATNKGITLATFRRYVKRSGTVADLKRLTTKQAGIVYRKRYWDKVRGDQLPDGVDYAVFDFAVNSGPARAAKYLQRIVGAAQDGRIGPKTLAAVNAYVDGNPTMRRTLIDKLCDDRMAFLRRLRHWSTFGRGWTRRVEDVRQTAFDMARTARAADRPKTKPEPPKKKTGAGSTATAGAGIGAAILAAIEAGVKWGLIIGAVVVVAYLAWRFRDRIKNIFGG